MTDGNGFPLGFTLTGGQAHESTAFELVLQEADQSLHFDDGSPVAWPIGLAGDKGYRADWIDELLIGLGIKPVIPSKANEDQVYVLVRLKEPSAVQPHAIIALPPEGAPIKKTLPV
ncbi:MAG: transposase, partial [Rubripirellula sp.]|nr:transposase [Rubripirellula sp.]